MGDSCGPPPDDGAGVNFVENEDSSKRARVDVVVPPAPPAPHAATVTMTNKAAGDRQDVDKTDVLFRTTTVNRMSLSLL